MFAKKDPLHQLQLIMDKETELLNSYFTMEKDLFTAVTERNWKQLEKSVEEMEKTGEAITSVENRREEICRKLYKQYGGEGVERFYRFIQRLPEEVRNPLSESFRNMKVAVFRLQALDGQIQGYLRSAATTLKDIVEEVFPDQKGTLYCKKGKTSAPDSNPMFISRHL